MFTNFTGETAKDVWCKIADSFQNGSGWIERDGRGGKTKEILHATISIENPIERWVSTRQKSINVALALAEVVWILSGRNDSAFIKEFYPDIIKFSGDTETWHGAYGYRLKYSLGIDQIYRAYNILKSNPVSRQVVMQIWECKLDMPNEIGMPRSQDTPCNIVSMLKVVKGRLEWLQVMRSNDFFKGLPNNFVQFTFLQELMAGWLRLDLGTYNHVSDSLHVYEKDMDSIYYDREDDVPKSTDIFKFGIVETQSYINKIAEVVDGTISEGHSSEYIPPPVNMPVQFKNIYCILLAELARRKDEQNVMSEHIRHCENPLYKYMWERWMNRVRR